MPAFDFAPLAWWGLPLVAAPVLIHLINLLRHRRVPWAAMELLLASQKKYKTRILLKQLLLLALRTAAVAGIVLALAQPRWRSALGSLFGLPPAARHHRKTGGAAVGGGQGQHPPPHRPTILMRAEQALINPQQGPAR